MNPPYFHGTTKVDEDSQILLDKEFNVVDAIGVTPRHKPELPAYQFKDVSQVLFDQ